MDIEWATISKTIETGGFDTLAAAHITHSFFVDPDNAAVFGWVRDHWNQYGTSPGVEAFRHEYPADQLIETPEPLSYYIDELREARRFAMIQATLDQIKEPLRHGDTSMALKVMSSGLENIHGEVVAVLDENIPATWEDRMGRYDLLTEFRGGLLGPPTGFHTMDIATGGLQDQQLITLIGLPKSYKSMLLMMMNIAAHQAGNSTLFASFEMTNTEQTTRHDALRAGVSLSRLQKGQFEEWERKRLVRMMHNIEDAQPMMMIHDPAGVTTVSAIAAKIAQHRPDVVFIDGAYLMDCEEPGVVAGSPQALTFMTRSLKRLAQRFDVPVVQTTQALSWKARKGHLTLDSIGYSSSFAQDSDVIFGVEQIPENDREIRLRIIASRNCPRKDITLALDLDHGMITEVDEMDYGSDDMGAVEDD